MTTGPALLRPATVADAHAIAEVQKRALWREHVDEEPPDLPVADGETLVADVDGRVYGFATVGASRREGSSSEEGELMALYVDPPAQGAGLGSALLAAAEDALRAAGYAQAVACVLDADDAARCFYERHGWHHDGQPAHHGDSGTCVHHHRSNIHLPPEIRG